MIDWQKTQRKKSCPILHLWWFLLLWCKKPNFLNLLVYFSKKKKTLRFVFVSARNLGNRINSHLVFMVQHQIYVMMLRESMNCTKSKKAEAQNQKCPWDCSLNPGGIFGHFEESIRFSTCGRDRGSKKYVNAL